MKDIHELSSLEMVDEFLKENKLSFLYISKQDCGVCHAILPKLRKILDHYPQIQFGHIDADEVEELVGRFLIFTVPTMLLMVEQKEYIRENGYVRMEQLNEQIKQIYTMAI